MQKLFLRQLLNLGTIKIRSNGVDTLRSEALFHGLMTSHFISLWAPVLIMTVPWTFGLKIRFIWPIGVILRLIMKLSP